MMFRNQQSFGIADAQFHHDVGFYMFRLPFIAFVLDWLFAAVLLVWAVFIVVQIVAKIDQEMNFVRSAIAPEISTATIL